MTRSQYEMRQVVHRLGDVVHDSAAWPSIMEEVARAVGATGAALLQCDARTPDVPRTAGVADLFAAYFGGNWQDRDIRARGAPLLARRERSVVTDHDVVTADEMERGAYYNELLRPFGFRWFAALGFSAGSAHWALSIHRTARQGMFEAPELRRLASLAPHLTQAATLSSAVGCSVLSGIRDALALCKQPAMILDRFGYVLGANDLAEMLFDDDFRIRHRRLHVEDRHAARELDRLGLALKYTPEIAAEEFRPIPMKQRGGGGRSFMIHVLPVPPAARGPFLGARAMLVFSSPVAPVAADPLALIRSFGLTPAEARVAVLLCDGMTVAEIADVLGVAVATVRNHLKAVFAKTDTHRQAELARLVSRIGVMGL